MENAAALESSQACTPDAERSERAAPGNRASGDTNRHVQTLGEQESIWFKLSVLTRHDDPIAKLQRASQKTNGCIHINLKDDRIFFLSDIEHFKHVLIEKPAIMQNISMG